MCRTGSLNEKGGVSGKGSDDQECHSFYHSFNDGCSIGNRVYINLFSTEEEEQQEIRHISLAQWADMIVIAPASANTISKLAHGVADDLLTSTILAFEGEVIIVPAMNKVMVNNSVYKDNALYLLQKGYNFIKSERGSLACGDFGEGRMAEPAYILKFINNRITQASSLSNKKILITASATREPIDRVRFISNYSTGKMGFALAETAKRRGAEVILITGPTFLADIAGIETIRVNTAAEMREEVFSRFKKADVFISAAAVSDFRPAEQFDGKIKKEERETLTLELKKNADILKEAGEEKVNQVLVGFAAEASQLKENGLSKLRSKNLDFIVVNDITREDSGFGVIPIKYQLLTVRKKLLITPHD